MSEVILTEENFDEEVINYKGLVLVDFWATWCGPCKMLAPVVAQVAEANEGVVKVGKVDVDDCMNLAREYEISSIPALILFKDGEPINQLVGFTNKETIEAMWK